MCRVNWQEEQLPGEIWICRDGGWSAQTWGGWVCDDVPGALFGVCESGVAESVIGDCGGRPVGNVMLHESDVDVRDADGNGSWVSDVGRGALQDVTVSSLKCAWDVFVVHMDCMVLWYVVEMVEGMDVVLEPGEVGRMVWKDAPVEWEEKVDGKMDECREGVDSKAGWEWECRVEWNGPPWCPGVVMVLERRVRSQCQVVG